MKKEVSNERYWNIKWCSMSKDIIGKNKIGGYGGYKIKGVRGI